MSRFLSYVDFNVAQNDLLSGRIQDINFKIRPPPPPPQTKIFTALILADIYSGQKVLSQISMGENKKKEKVQ